MPLNSFRWPAGLAVLLLHLGFIALLLQAAQIRLPTSVPVFSVLSLIKPAPPPPTTAPPSSRPPTDLKFPPVALPPVPVPEVPSPTQGTPSLSVVPLPSQEPAPSAGGPSAPLNLSLPRNGGRGEAAPVPAQLAAQDGRANSPRDGAVERMANALGAKGWTVLDLGDGSRKVTGPFGECQIIRPSMVDGIPGHPHAGLLPARVFGCGGIEKGSIKNERPK